MIESKTGIIGVERSIPEEDNGGVNMGTSFDDSIEKGESVDQPNSSTSPRGEGMIMRLISSLEASIDIIPRGTSSALSYYPHGILTTSVTPAPYTVGNSSSQSA